jgi:hypothetical protein
LTSKVNVIVIDNTLQRFPLPISELDHRHARATTLQPDDIADPDRLSTDRQA